MPNVRGLRRKQAATRDRERLKIAERFTSTWVLLIAMLRKEYSCPLSCPEADAVADLLRAFGHGDTADYVLQLHAESDEECEDQHHVCTGECE